MLWRRVAIGPSRPPILVIIFFARSCFQWHVCCRRYFKSCHMTTNQSPGIRFAKIPLGFGSGTMPALGFGTLIPDPAETRSATTNALRVGFRHFDCAERYRNEREVGEALQGEFAI